MSSLIQDGRPVSALVDLARRHGIQANNEMTAQELSALMQGGWLRKPEYQYQVPSGPPQEEDWQLLKALGMVDAVSAPTGDFAGALLLGATVTGVRRRLAYLVAQYKIGVKPKKVYLLASSRPLDSIRENAAALTTPVELTFKEGWKLEHKLPTTEFGMMLLVWEQSELPSGLGATAVFTPEQKTPDGKPRGTTTEDTIESFLKRNPQAGDYLIVSSQPYVKRQTLNASRRFPPELKAVGIGPAAAPTLPLQTFLDEVARLLYEELAAKN